MKTIFIILALFFSLSAFAQDHNHHVKHNMVLFGKGEIFVSHIVYKQPHNYQVILKLDLEPKYLDVYLAELAKYPKDQFIYLLDKMDIKNIADTTSISGVFLRTDSTGARIEFLNSVQLRRNQFEIIYFDEVPLSLVGNH